jgi:hypothetical protein
MACRQETLCSIFSRGVKVLIFEPRHEGAKSGEREAVRYLEVVGEARAEPKRANVRGGSGLFFPPALILQLLKVE